MNKPCPELHFPIEFGFSTSNVSHGQFTAPLMHWTTPEDLHKRFKIFKQKCNLIFDGPSENNVCGG